VEKAIKEKKDKKVQEMMKYLVRELKLLGEDVLRIETTDQQVL